MGGPVKITPASRWYVLGGVLVAAGIVGGLVAGLASYNWYSDKLDNMYRINLPGQAPVVLDDAGEYTVYHEYSSDSNRRASGEVQIEVIGPDGSEVVLEEDTSTGEVSYYLSERRGVAIYSFEARAPGTYEFSVSGLGDKIAVGKGADNFRAGAVMTQLGIGTGVSVGGAGVVIVIVVAIKRGNSKRRLTPRTPPPPPPGWGYPPPGMMSPPTPPAPPAAPSPTPSAG